MRWLQLSSLITSTTMRPRKLCSRGTSSTKTTQVEILWSECLRILLLLYYGQRGDLNVSSLCLILRETASNILVLLFLSLISRIRDSWIMISSGTGDKEKMKGSSESTSLAHRERVWFTVPVVLLLYYVHLLHNIF